MIIFFVFLMVLMFVGVLIAMSCRRKPQPPAPVTTIDPDHLTKPQIVHLVLFSTTYPYREMMEITRPWYAKQSPTVRTIFYCFDESINGEWQYCSKEMCLRIRGKETYVPGILLKTLQAIRIVLELFPNCEYIVRSNVSSVIDIPKLVQELNAQLIPVQYGGFMLNELRWIDPAGGVVDETWWGTRYASGTCFILSRALASEMINQIHQFRLNLVDDLSIGVWMREYAPNVPIWQSSRKDWLYRNRKSNREDDLVQMKMLVQQLTSE